MVKVLAERNGWSPTHAKGYIDGQTSRRRGMTPSKYAQVGIDQYCLGFRAGYYDRKDPGSMRSKNPASPLAKLLRNPSKSAGET
ncbi:MAG: hypothetical protein OEO84_02365 [Betaproteobacteria bacterium]|nr:hypothetical protein [Betaproteobacteria bacterium]MDH5537190.1 hypothetical protein [Betaproteobacteria bacterium]